MTEIVQVAYAESFPLEGLAAILAGIPHRVEDYDGVLEGLRLCQSLGQLRFWMRGDRLMGVLSWLRAEEEHIRGSLDDFKRLPMEELMHGPCLLIVEILVLSPGLAYPAIRWLAKLPGVEQMGGWRRGRHFAFQSTRNRVEGG